VTGCHFDLRARAAEIGTVGALLAFYLVVSLYRLDTVPPAYGDEMWESSVAWMLATRGTFGSDMFTGFYGMEAHYYDFLPLHPVLLAATYRLFGLGLFQARLVSVAMGFLVLLLTHALGRRLFGWRVGALAVAFLVLVRLAGTTRYVTMGIPLLDVARIARYDIVVPVLGLASLHMYLSARRGAAGLGHVIAGLLAGLAGLAHLYGAFWILALAVLALCDRAATRTIGQLALGFAIPWLPYAAFVLAHPGDWLGQTRHYAPRFDLLNPRWYWSNLVAEPRRYGPGLGSPGWAYLTRPGFWMTLVLLPASVFALARRGLARDDPAARALAIPLLVLGTLFAVLLHEKLAYYALTIWPLGALAVAWGGLTLWRRAHRGWVRGAIIALLAAVAVEGATRIGVLWSSGATATRHDQFLARVRAHVPDGSRVLGLHDWWMAFHDLDYRAWPVILWKSTPEIWSPPLTVAGTLDEMDPDVILIDSGMRAFFDGNPKGPAVYGWMRDNRYREVASLTDPTYGTMHIYRRER
jgi:4-amino-4-deoxy-L-arabinose transferase-like glycosyltransferase